jgi:hypothetical protein
MGSVVSWRERFTLNISYLPKAYNQQRSVPYLDAKRPLIVSDEEPIVSLQKQVFEMYPSDQLHLTCSLLAVGQGKSVSA